MPKRKKSKIVNAAEDFEASRQIPSEIHWEKCCLCQEDRAETLVCPMMYPGASKGAGYKTLADDLLQMNELGELSGIYDGKVQLKNLDDG